MEIEEENITINQRIRVLYEANITKPETIVNRLAHIKNISVRTV